MRTRILKMILPVFVLMLAVFGAFSFKSAEKDALFAPETGWINLPGQPCFKEVQCDTTPSSFICSTIHNGMSYPAYGKVSQQPPVCNKVLYRKL